MDFHLRSVLPESFGLWQELMGNQSVPTLYWITVLSKAGFDTTLFQLKSSTCNFGHKWTTVCTCGVLQRSSVCLLYKQNKEISIFQNKKKTEHIFTHLLYWVIISVSKKLRTKFVYMKTDDNGGSHINRGAMQERGEKSQTNKYEN